MTMYYVVMYLIILGGNFVSDIKLAEIVECISVCYCRNRSGLACRNCQYNKDIELNCQTYMYQFHLLPKEKKEKICNNNFIPYNFWE